MKKSIWAFLFLFSVCALAVLGPWEEAEGQGKKPDPKGTKPDPKGTRPDPKGGHVIPGPGVNPNPVHQPIFIPADIHLPDTTKIVIDKKGTKSGGFSELPRNPGSKVFSPNLSVKGANFTAPMVFKQSFSNALNKTQTTNMYVKNSQAKFAPHALMFKSSMHKHYLTGLWFGPNFWLNHPCACAHWHPYHHHKHHHWWWFQTPNWTVCTDWVIYDWKCPFYYDCGVNIVYRDNYVYLNNVSVASYQDYAYQAFLLSEVAPPPPKRKIEWLSMGVYYLASSRQVVESDLVLSLAVNPQGEFSGTLYNRGTDTTAPVTGKVQHETQRVAIRLSETNDLVMDTGFQNLTLSHFCVHMHFGKAETGTWLTQTWFAVRADALPQE